MTRSTRRTELRRTWTLRQAIAQLVDHARERDCRLVRYSIYERDVIQDYLPARSPERRAFESLWYNVKTKANALRKRRRLDAPDDKLDSLIRALMPKHKSCSPPTCGAAEAGRRLEKAGAKSQRWSNWAPRHKQLAKDILAYNKGDCVAVWKLVNRVAANYAAPELA